MAVRLLSRVPRAYLARALGGASLLGGSTVLAQTEPRSAVQAKHAKSSNELFFDVLPSQSRTIYLSGSIDDASAKLVIGQLLALEFQQPGEPITMLISSAGGKVYAGLGIVDMMNFISSPVRTVCVGHCESMGAIILAAGEPGQRFALPHARIMLHQPFARLGDVRRTAEDVRLHAEELGKTRATLLELCCRATGKTVDEIGYTFDKDSYFNAQEAVTLGVIDCIAERLEQVAGPKAPASSSEQPQKEIDAPLASQQKPAV